MKYLFLLLRILLFLVAVVGLYCIYFVEVISVSLLTRVLFWILLVSTILGLWIAYREIRREA